MSTRPPPGAPQRRPDSKPPRPNAASSSTRPQTAPPPAGHGEPVRLNKRMAELGLCSRREADAWIERGWVRVDGVVAEMGAKVRPDARISVDRQATGEQAQRVTILLHKPIGFVSGQAEDGHAPAVTLIEPRNHWREDGSRLRFSSAQLRGLAPAGRLDIDSTGLLVLTQDGRVARTLIGEDSTIEKEYLVRVRYDPSGAASGGGPLAPGHEDAMASVDVRSVVPPEALARLRHGLSLDGVRLKPARVEWQNEEQLRFVLTEGRKRQIRRMCALVGLTVVGLKRVRIGRVMLGRLPLGQWRYLGPDERF
ncbi:pseudouridine synthase [Tibeticola sp.]|uniref:pseudouridine synthase n=1 Tax=Tibeticola sp. TaxID=2005368 RepID=UPI0025875151|nr:pseudouridine synthase [Tibeticola sp.]MCI4439700.1 rRNA pseudouridine synthase [Tibeticola sp.]